MCKSGHYQVCLGTLVFEYLKANGKYKCIAIWLPEVVSDSEEKASVG